MIAARDPYGFRPLVLGQFPTGKNRGAYVFASETCALDLIEANYVRDVEPGELSRSEPTVWSRSSRFRRRRTPNASSNMFISPGPTVICSVTTSIECARVWAASWRGRAACRRIWSLRCLTPACRRPWDIAEESGIPLEFGLIRNHYVGRTFIEPQQTIRNFGVKIKLNAQRDVLNGKRVVVVDDSIVRGTTSRKIIRMLRDAGAKEVHMRISSPATISPCYYGIDTPTRSELIASSNTVEEIRRFIEADTLAYLSNEGLFAYFDGKKDGFCDACFTGNYPVHFEDEGHTRQLHLFDA